MYKLKGSLETKCTHVKGNLEQNMYKFQEKFGNNSMYTCKGKCGNTMYKSKEIWKHDEQIQRKSRKNKVQLQGKFGNTMYRFKGTCANSRYKIQWEFGNNVKKGKGKFGETHVQCTMYNLQESLETQCAH